MEASSFSWAQRLALDLQLHQLPLDLVQLFRLAVDFHFQMGRRLVDEVNRFVGQLTVGQVAIA